MNEKGLTVYLALWIIMIIGWLVNLVDVILFAVSGGEWTTMTILQVVGIFAAPLGSVLGYIAIFN